MPEEPHLSRILENPLYVRANKEVYAYFLAKGYEMLDNAEDYDGVHGLYVHAGADNTHFVKLGYHEGLVDGDIWLRVQDRKAHQHKFPSNCKAMNSWLVGLMKCGNCGYAMHINHSQSSTGKKCRNFYDYGKYTLNGCSHKEKVGLRPDDVESAVLQAMRDKIESLKIAKFESQKPNAESESVKAEILRCDEEIHKLMEKLADADTVLFDYIQKRVTALHEEKSKLENKLQMKSRKQKVIDTKPLEEPMSRWDDMTVQEKHDLAVTMIDVVYISDEHGIEIKFSI